MLARISAFARFSSKAGFLTKPSNTYCSVKNKWAKEDEQRKNFVMDASKNKDHRDGENDRPRATGAVLLL
jgi:hypothetical protein